MKRHWAINGRFLTQPLTGVQRYAFEVVRSLDELLVEQPLLASDLDVEVLMPPGGKDLSLRAIRVRRVGPLAAHAWEQAVLPLHVRGGLLSLCNTGPLAIRKQVLCIHDVNTRSYPQSYSVPFRFLYRFLLPALGRRVAQLVTVSRYSADELVRYRIGRPGEVAVIPNGHEHACRWRPRHSAKTLAVAGRDTVVVIGSPAPHKNTGLIIGIADRLKAAGLRVALVGSCDARVFRAAGLQNAVDNVISLGRLSDEELAALLRDCLCLAFPSFVEGFGLPPLEAMAIGCPVVASDRASLPEICDTAVLYASPCDAEAWLACFTRLRDNPKLRETLTARGRARAALFQWRASAGHYLEAMAALDALPVTSASNTRTQLTA